MIAPFLLLNISPVQRYAVSLLTEHLGKTLHTEVRIGHVDWQLLNRLVLEDVYMSDQNGDTLIAVQTVNARFYLPALLRKEINLRRIILESPQFRVAIDSLGQSNLAFLFSEQIDDTLKSPFSYHIDLVKINDGQLFFDSQLPNSSKASGKFDAGHIRLSELQSEMRIDNIEEKHWQGIIRSLSFKEASGVNVRDFHTKFTITDSVSLFSQTQLLLPETTVTIDTVHFRYPDFHTITDSIERVTFFAHIAPSTIVGADLEAFYTPLKHFRQGVAIEGTVSGSLDNVNMSHLDLRYGEIALNGNAHVTGLPHIDETFVSARINHLNVTMSSLQDIIANLSQKPVVMPKELHNVKRCTYSGKLTGSFNRMTLDGTLKTGIGTVKTDVTLCASNNFEDLEVVGYIHSNGLDLAAITPSGSGLGSVAFEMQVSARKSAGNPLETQAQAVISAITYQNHTYYDLSINGMLAKNIFNGIIDIRDKNGELQFNGTVDFQEKVRKLCFEASIKHLKPYELGLIKTYPDLEASLTMTVNIEAERLEQIVGTIKISAVEIKNHHNSYFLDSLLIKSHSVKDGTLTTVESPVINGNISGNYRLATLPDNFMQIVKRYLPILQEKTENFKPVWHQEPFDNDMRFYFTIAPTETLCRTLELAWFTEEQSMLSGFYNDDCQCFNAELNIPILKYGKRRFNESALRCYNVDNQIMVRANTVTNAGVDTFDVNLNIALSRDTAFTHIIWHDRQQKERHAGEVVAQTRLFLENDSLYIHTGILPTQMLFNSTSWDISCKTILTNLEWIDIDHLSISGFNQHILVDGKISNSETDRLHIEFKDISLDYLSDLLPDKSNVSFGGQVSGKADISQLFEKPVLIADVMTENFVFNEALLGYVHATSDFDNDRMGLIFNGVVMPDKTDTAAVIEGAYFFPNDSLDLKGVAKKLDLQFINSFTKDIINIESGYGTGNVHVYGRTKPSTILVETKALVTDGRVGIDYLNASVLFEDSIILTKDKIILDNIAITDGEGHSGVVNGELKHHYFKDIVFNIGITANNMLALNTGKETGENFYGKAYATGTATISGYEGRVNILCNLTSEPNTKIVIPIDANYSATDNTFITFVEKTPQVHRIQTKSQQKEKPAGSNELNIDLTLNVNTNAAAAIIIDSQSGDMLSGTGDGTLRIIYNPQKEGLKIHGTYTIQQGKYIFTFQNALRREFRVSDGSTLVWSGDPTNPTININALYQTTASLADVLDEAILSNANRTSVVVQCLLDLRGNLMQPTIKFNLNLPNSDEELNRALKNAVNTDELMMNEIIYLMVMNKFYTPDNLQRTTLGQNDVFSVVSSTLSAQLNNWASQLFEGWDFGVNFRTTSEGETRSNEYEVSVAYSPNGRIMINGNVGYRDDKLSSSKFIGDFDVEYKLIRSGKLSAKAYTHTTDYNEFKEAPTTQGIGIVYRENFDSLADLWQNWKNAAREGNKTRKNEKKKDKKRKHTTTNH
jgi:hypothetical protein